MLYHTIIVSTFLAAMAAGQQHPCPYRNQFISTGGCIVGEKCYRTGAAEADALCQMEHSKGYSSRHMAPSVAPNGLTNGEWDKWICCKPKWHDPKGSDVPGVAPTPSGR
ncbi:hypothetical protein E2P81_ATG06917 [Venturia nashicola]|uniref:Uncharacterized protein n=1 Tax=Venturia nashicola TaxID=86259 RepID=A0A4Z1NUL8_9PEZI|nr:hypothetical protein E6O75_ATG07088 [Venturia nashicola]TLD30264.1 hypothetical protein E2P81_ATG06917 [Venturia nashicola]